MRRVSGGVHERRDDRRRAVHLRDRHRRRGGAQARRSGPSLRHAAHPFARHQGCDGSGRGQDDGLSSHNPGGARLCHRAPRRGAPLAAAALAAATHFDKKQAPQEDYVLTGASARGRALRALKRALRARTRALRARGDAQRPPPSHSGEPPPLALARARARPRAEGFDVQEADNLNNLHLHRRLHHHRHHPAGPARVRPPAPPRTHRGAGTRTTRTSHTSLPEAGRPPSSPMAATRPHLGALRAPPPTHLGALRAPTPTHPPHTVALRAPTLWRASRANPHVLRPSEAKATRSQGHRSRGHQKPRRRNQKEPTCHRPERSRGP